MFRCTPISRRTASCARQQSRMSCRGVPPTALAPSRYSPLFRGLLFGTWSKDKTFPASDGRSTHKDYAGARFQRHLQAIDEIRALAAGSGLSVPQLCVGVLLQTPGLTGVIVGARSARQGGVISSLAVSISADQAAAVWSIAGRLAKDLETLPT